MVELLQRAEFIATGGPAIILAVGLIVTAWYLRAQIEGRLADLQANRQALMENTLALQRLVDRLGK